ncbi:NAD(P)-dependent oxidoreductase [Phaeobacter sp. B1627]|uniref:NAD-dependent epimerase/dehydratase family protein n=1 Tax=Phaeobacter sp. B1627 TaxID=2583809 RepID=UPI00111970D7|nr:NAD-dependent epimerase/dehydratase family protein [Phaeobacter sp. B1627]TNJ40952.1 NAD-dependent epimerase/dehydratase family protein [Phaeobacter sp. B1627]
MFVTFLLTPLVLGASGRIGRSLRHRWGPDAALWQARRAPGRAQEGPGWQIFDPLADPAALAAAARQSGQILCLAGGVPGRGGDLGDNLRLAEAAIHAAAEAGIRVILASSAAVYGARGGALHEDLTLTPTHPYGQAKADMEAQAARLGAELGVSVCALRIGNVAGFDAVLGGWRPGFRLDQFPDGRSPRRSYIGPATLADVIAALLAAPRLPEVLNIAQPGPVEMAVLLRAAGRDYATVPAPETAIAEVELDVARLAAFLAPHQPLPVADPTEMLAEIAMLEPHIKDGSHG